MRKREIEREQEKPWEELTLDIFLPSSLTLHGKRGGDRLRGQRSRGERKEARWVRGRRDHPLSFTSSFSPCLKVSIGCMSHTLSILSILLLLCSLSPSSSPPPFISSLSLLSSGYISHTFPLCFSSPLPYLPSWLCPPLPPPSCDQTSSTLMSSLLSTISFCWSHPPAFPSSDWSPSCVTSLSPHPSSCFPPFFLFQPPLLSAPLPAAAVLYLDSPLLSSLLLSHPSTSPLFPSPRAR